MKFDNPGKVEELVWNSRIADMPRSENRAILQRMYGGEPPFNEDQAEENGIQINRNDLTGVNLLAQARRQWNSAFLGPKNYFSVSLDCGPAHKRLDWGGIITRNINKQLKRNPKMREQIRATGANVMLHGIGPVNWPDRRTPIPNPIPVSSLLIPSETEIDFDNLEWFAVFREYTPSQLYQLTHGPKRDPGWSMPMVMSQLRHVCQQVQKQPNATAYQYMPERIEELVKQDLGFWGSDAVPTIDAWDFYFREAGDKTGWYRRVILDWGLLPAHGENMGVPSNSPNRIDEKGEFLYTSGKRKYADCHSQIINCQFGDCSAYAPFKYHSVRSLGWMIWGACDLQNRLYCKFMENAFMNLMWWFRVSGEGAFNRLKRADFFHMGVIPDGVNMIPNAERFVADAPIIQQAFGINRQLLAENAASFTSDFAKGDNGKEMTATETMARVNATNALVSGMLTLAYTYEEPKDREICRRFTIRNNPDRGARNFIADCLKEGVPMEYLDAEKWNVEVERVVGGGNKTLQMAAVQFLNSIRKNFNPQGQRIVDHMSVYSATDSPELADSISPLDEEKEISGSMHDAQLATDRLMRGLPFVMSKKMVLEDYVRVWIADMALIIQKIEENGGMATAEQISGLANMQRHIDQFLQVMSGNEDEKEKVRQYADTLAQLMNQVKAFAQRLAQQMKAQAAPGENGNGQDAETKAKLQGKVIIDQAKAEASQISHSQKTAQRQVQFEMEEKRKDKAFEAELQRENARTAQELRAEAAKNRLELDAEAERLAIEQAAAEEASKNQETTPEE